MMDKRRLPDSGHPKKVNTMIDERKRPLSTVLILFLMMCVGSYGCTSMQIPDYPKASPASLSNATTQKDLCIAVRAITDKGELEQYFGTDLSEVKVLPVYIVAENTSSSTSFLLSRDHVSMQHKDAGSAFGRGDLSVTGDSTAGKATVGLGAVSLFVVPVLAPVIILSGGKAISDATVVKQNLAAKALHTRTVSPGKSVDGFVYFTLPDKAGPLSDWSVSLEVKELGSDPVLRFTFSLE